ncbi:hypothetical protein A2V56_04525 [Candidatus Woesebacteria bacterium RBG_19FT_COMBO_42_9]|uniref:Peptidase S11 D-alanyl-D-alanine carboxypeptidase A N-terminal domain-containing protein n=1 Tax=Candidatus Woesebacteria bacterium RBG_16_42_24 TaxID=1802485 RepID=A0A1F7XMI1_9BACT|nr:MAG: hypothetical protein A2V97_04510 [Candidatus Woesebacteria bacterium RBG_16_42_24]OGM16228.1 MAG: hypothetical protein A2V56_04525 [Candidatus Woesebacteria bacterium RBG_19FT_COMBO_42_9]OGM66324.1 MAG: hypothetical protein A2985_03940 [Candidatus Woesebacteria bacterium RIFCSPLOWO2_01_FULL_43_11]
MKLTQREFLYGLIVSFFLIASSALALSKKEINVAPLPQKPLTTVYSSLPVLAEKGEFPILSAQSALAVDLASGVVLYEKNPDTPYLPASTTKIITALVAMDYYPMDAVLTVDRIGVAGQKMGLVAGEQISVASLLDGLLIFSANDAAEVLADNFPGGREEFVEAMNIKAERFNLDNSYFTNPTGLDGDSQVATARDLIRIAEIAMRNVKFARIVGTKAKIVTSVDGRIVHKLTNINELIGEVPGVFGVKTGWTENARENLVTYIERDKRRVMITIMGSQDRFGETKELISWIFENYKWEEVKYPTHSP